MCVCVWVCVCVCFFYLYLFVLRTAFFVYYHHLHVLVFICLFWLNFLSVCLTTCLFCFHLNFVPISISYKTLFLYEFPYKDLLAGDRQKASYFNIPAFRQNHPSEKFDFFLNRISWLSKCALINLTNLCLIWYCSAPLAFLLRLQRLILTFSLLVSGSTHYLRRGRPLKAVTGDYYRPD